MNELGWYTHAFGEPIDLPDPAKCKHMVFWRDSITGITLMRTFEHAHQAINFENELADVGEGCPRAHINVIDWDDCTI